MCSTLVLFPSKLLLTLPVSDRSIGTDRSDFCASHHPFGSAGFVRTSPCWSPLGTHPSGSFAPHRSLRRLCLKAARSIASLRSVGTLGMPCLCTWSNNERQSERHKIGAAPCSTCLRTPSLSVSMKDLMYCAPSSPSTQAWVSAPNVERHTLWPARERQSPIENVPLPFFTLFMSAKRTSAPICDATFEFSRFAFLSR